jgi:hypothetical protein
LNPSARWREPRALLLAASFAVVMLVSCNAAAGEPPKQVALEQAVKAAYLYNFAKFVSWPADSSLTRAPALTIGVLSDASFLHAVEATVRGKQVAGRPLAVRHFRTVKDVEPCEVLFIDRTQAEHLPELRERLAGWPVLTVSDAEGFASRGGMIGLFLEDGRVRFEVGVAAARTGGLQVSSKLLRLSRSLTGPPCQACAVGAGLER